MMLVQSRIRSVKKQLQIKLLLLVLTVFAGYTASFGVYIQVIREYREMMERHKHMARLPIELGHMVDEFESYILTRDSELKDSYEGCSVKVAELLQPEHFCDIIPPGTQAYSAIRRSLIGMIEYYDQSARQIMTLKAFDDGTFQEMSYLRIQAVYIVVRAQELVVAYLDASNLAHEEFLLRWRKTQIRLFAALLILLAFDLMTVLIFVRDLSKHLMAVEGSARELSRKNWTIPDLEETHYSELKSVGDAFNDMKRNIVGFIEEIERNAELDSLLNKEKLAASEREKTLRETQLRALQLQINPHFLFNTLNMVSRSALFDDKDQTISLVESISHILRYSLDNEGREVPFREEIGVLKSYLLIQEVRHGDRIAFRLDVDETGEELSVPPMILQPLVENAISHGLKGRASGGEVKISAMMEESGLYISVEDNGTGISEEELERLMHPAADEGTSGIGVSNVRKRLLLSFGAEAGFRIESSPGQGTSIRIRIPRKGDAR